MHTKSRCSSNPIHCYTGNATNDRKASESSRQPRGVRNQSLMRAASVVKRKHSRMSKLDFFYPLGDAVALGYFLALGGAGVVNRCARRGEVVAVRIASGPWGNFHSQDIYPPRPSRSGNSDLWLTPKSFSSDIIDSALLRGTMIRSTMACFPLSLCLLFIAGELSIFFSFPKIRNLEPWAAIRLSIWNGSIANGHFLRLARSSNSLSNASSNSNK